MARDLLRLRGDGAGELVGGDGGEAVGTEDFGNCGEVLFVGGVDGLVETELPVDGLVIRRGELLLPAFQVEADVGEAFAVMDFGVRGVAEMGRGAGVGVVGGALGEAGADGVLFDVEHGGAVMGGAQRQGAEVVFPEVAVGLVLEEDLAGVLRLEVAHEVGDAAFAKRFEDEMDVVGHQAEGVNADFVAASQAVEAVEIGEELGLGIEYSLAAIAALVDVIDAAAFEGAKGAGGNFDGSGHIDKCVERGKILTYFQIIFIAKTQSKLNFKITSID